jgi:addiction module HigA family antidote
MLYRHADKALQQMAATLPTLAKAFPPGDFIREELEERGWTQQELAERMGRPLQAVNMIVNGRKAITAETAYQLQNVFGPSANYWMNLESAWQLYKVAEKKNAERGKGSRRTPEAESSSSGPRLTEATIRERLMAKGGAMLPSEGTSRRVAAKGQGAAGVVAKICAPGLVAPKKRKARKPSPK